LLDFRQPNPGGAYTYDVFGAVRSHTGASTEFSYTGKQNDPNGLEYLRARATTSRARGGSCRATGSAAAIRMPAGIL
jgi:hypothetical protein